MEVPNLNCKWCEYQTELWREHCAECLFNLEQLFKQEKSDTLTDIDGEFCMWCSYQYTDPNKCDGCIWNKTPLATE